MIWETEIFNKEFAVGGCDFLIFVICSGICVYMFLFLVEMCK